MSQTRFIAIDWSGRSDPAGQRKHIWIADSNHPTLALTNGRTREEAIAYLTDAAHEDRQLVVGLDFAFSFPAWFVREQGCSNITEFWNAVATRGEGWLRFCTDPFWGRPQRCRPLAHTYPETPGLRLTELLLRTAGLQPKSTFQVGGAGAVGTGSIRGMPFLTELREAGFRIWPFHPHEDPPAGLPSSPLVIEIYPRLFLGRLKVADPHARADHLNQSQFSGLPEEILTRARNSEDAFDALCAVLGMTSHAEALANLEPATDPAILLEGQIWTP